MGTTSEIFNREQLEIIKSGSHCFIEGFQDSQFYQNFSYVIRSSQLISLYRDFVKKLVHPAGVALFGQYLLNSIINAYPQNASIVPTIKLFFYSLFETRVELYTNNIEIDIFSDLVENLFTVESLSTLLSNFEIEGIINLLDFSPFSEDTQTNTGFEYDSRSGKLSDFYNINLSEFDEDFKFLTLQNQYIGSFVFDSFNANFDTIYDMNRQEIPFNYIGMSTIGTPTAEIT